MTKAQPAADRAAKRMYRGIVTAQVIADVFVRAKSDIEANRLIECGKGQRMRPRYSEWQLWQEAVSVDAYTASNIPAEAIPRMTRGLTADEIGAVYLQVRNKISALRGSGTHTDSECQAIATAIREFYDLLKGAIRAKAAPQTN